VATLIATLQSGQSTFQAVTTKFLFYFNLVVFVFCNFSYTFLMRLFLETMRDVAVAAAIESLENWMEKRKLAPPSSLPKLGNFNCVSWTLRSRTLLW
jgi:hypothetical protein